MGPVILDLSRTLARARLPTPSGIDRVERAYFDWIAGTAPKARFLVTAAQRHALLSPDAARELIDTLDSGDELPPSDLRGAFSRWKSERQRRADSLARRLADSVAADLGALIAPLGSRTLYLNVAQAHLDLDRLGALRAGGVSRAVAMIHDVIPLEHPEFARPAAPARLMAFLAAAGRCDGVVFNSADTAARARAHLDATPPACTALLGAAAPARAPNQPPAGAAEFVMLGTIEPRKNHLGMLRIWRRLHDELGAAAPHLHVIGRRGWENEMILDVLERSPMIGRCVFEHPGLDNAAVAARLARATALLLPSFAEGFGLPAAEALASGAPVIAADLPALREAAADAPDYLDPLDLPAWIETILNYAEPGSPRRAAQLARIAHWRAPSWQAHFDKVSAFIDRLEHRSA